jgi:hypothetical protein
VLGLEVSRLTRNNADWHRPLEICALTSTLIGLELAGKTQASPVRRRMKRLQWPSRPGSGRPRGRASDIGVLTAISPV